jgi:outer membrane lipoprotein SlyB
VSRHPRKLFYGLAILVMFVTVSCSQPVQTVQSAKSSQAESDETATKADIDRTPAETPKPVEKVKKEPPRAAAAPRPAAPVPVPSPAPAPAAPAQQTAVTVAPAPPPIALPEPPAPVQQSAPIPVPQPAAPPEPTTRRVTIPVGTEVYVRTIDPIDSEKGHVGEAFHASLDKPILVDGQTIVPRRSDVYLKLTAVESAGKLSGTSELQVQLDRIFIGKDAYTVATNTFTKTGSSSGKKAARNVGIGAAVGGVLGGILGGGKGAVIGAGAGGGGGAVISKGEQIRVDSETELMFRLENPVDVTITTTPVATSVRNNNGASGGPMPLTVPAEDRSSRRSSSNSTSTSNADDLTGSWSVRTEGSQGMTLDLSLRQNGSNLRGSITNPWGAGTIPVFGSVSGNYVTFSTQSQYGNNYNGQMQFSGALQGDTMEGSVTMPANGGYGTAGGYPGGGYPGGGYPGGGRSRRTGGYPAGGRSTQVHWTARRAD